MTQFAYVKLGNEWKDLETILGTTTVTTGNTYTFEARGGASGALIQEASTKPTDDSGVLLDRNGLKTFTWVAGEADEVWLKGDGCYVNITETADEADPVVPEVNSEEA